MLRMVLVMFVLLGTSCSDDGGSSGTDGGPTPDTVMAADGTSGQSDGPATQADGPAVGKDGPVTALDKGPPAGDTGTKPLNCQEISVCSETCTKGCSGNFACMMKCNTDCSALGCASAKPLFDKVNNCVQTKCLLQCIGGPSTGCSNCVTTKCSNEVAACNAHTCP
jgi:hypothetical protein